MVRLLSRSGWIRYNAELMTRPPRPRQEGVITRPPLASYSHLRSVPSARVFDGELERQRLAVVRRDRELSPLASGVEQTCGEAVTDWLTLEFSGGRDSAPILFGTTSTYCTAAGPTGRGAESTRLGVLP